LTYTPENKYPLPPKVVDARGLAHNLVTLGEISKHDLDSDEAFQEEPRKIRYSIPKLFVGLLFVVAVLTGGYYGVNNVIANSGAVVPTFFSPYVDATLTPTYQFQSANFNQAMQTTLGFVVAPGPDHCVPTWGGYYTLNQANQDINLQRRVVEYAQSGGQIMISFGGQRGISLAQACPNAASLANAYKTTMSTYRTNVMDLDIETGGLADFNGIQRNAAAVALAQKYYQEHHQQLIVWITLPVNTNGLQDNAKTVVREFLAHHVQVAGINIMAMDFGPPESDMFQAVQQAAISAHSQLVSIFPQYGIHLTSRQIWNRMGVTVMIGQNNSAGEVFTTADASSLQNFADNVRLGRVSMWSLNRDYSCGQLFTGAILSNTCSGLNQNPLQFSSIFSKLTGKVIPKKGAEAPIIISQQGSTNPANAPYPIWQPNVPYPQNYKVVWQGNVYEAKYYNEAVNPGAQVQFSYQTPWILLGPVLKTDHAPTI
jgi:chitinase